MSESSRPSPDRAQRLYDIAVSIGRGDTLSEATQAALSAYLRQLECVTGGIFRRDSEPAVPVYRLVESVSTDPTATDVVEATTGDLTHDSVADETAFRERLPIAATHEPAHYHVFDLPDFGVLVIVSDDGPLPAEMVAALEPVNETLADVCCARWTDTSARRPCETLRTVFDAIPRELSVTDSDGTYALANQAAAAAHGISVDELEDATDEKYPSPGRKRDAQQTDGQNGGVADRGGVNKETAPNVDGKDDKKTRTADTGAEDLPEESDRQQLVMGQNPSDSTTAGRQQSELGRQAAVGTASLEDISIVSAAGEFTHVSETYAEQFGYDSTDLVGETWRQLYPDQEIERITSDVFPTLTRDGVWCGEIVGQRRDGATTTHEAVLSRLEGGRLLCASRESAEQRLRETRFQHEQTKTILQTILDSLPAGVLVEDSNRDVLAVNQRLVELFEIDAPPEALVGTDYDAVIDQLKDNFAEPDQFASITSQHSRHRRAEEGEEFALTDSRTVAQDYVPYELPDGGANMWMYRDVTERVRRETAIRELLSLSSQTELGFEQQVQEVIEIGRRRTGMDAGFFSTIDTDADPAVGGFEIAVSAGSDVQFDTGTEIPLSKTYCRKTIEQPEPVGVTTARETWDGDPATEEHGLACYLGGRVIVDGEVYGTLCFTDDEPREKPFTQEESRFMRLLTQWLSFELECRNRETDLRETRRQLRQSNRDLEQFAHAASHDLKEPLRSVSNYLTLLDDLYEDGETLDERAVTLIQDAVGAADRMQSMINALLQYSQIDSSGGEFEPTALDGVVEKAELNLTVRVDDSDATVTTESLPTVEGDERLLIELFQNLIDNGLKYNHSSHPHISVTPGEPVASLDTPERVSLDSDGPWHHVCVADNGIGIDTDAASRAFEVFERLGQTEEDGTGMGLTLCRRIVDHHDGAMWIESAPGDGTTVHLCFPAA